jgi:hypothetical protein
MNECKKLSKLSTYSFKSFGVVHEQLETSIFFGSHKLSVPIVKQNKNQTLMMDVIKLHASYVREK